MEMVLYVQDEKPSVMKEGSIDSSTKAATFPGALSEESKAISVAGRTNSSFRIIFIIVVVLIE